MFYGGDMGEFTPHRERISGWKLSGMAYVWGRQDAGDAERDTGYSQHFAEVYALANVVTGGYAGPLQAAFHEWHDTRRILVKVNGRVASVSIAPASAERAECHLVPWAGDPYLPYWQGLVRKVHAV